MTASERLAGLVLGRGRLWFLVLAGILAVLSAGLPGLRFEGDSHAFFGADSQEYRDLKMLDETYSGSSPLLLMIAPAEGTAFEPATLAALRAFTEDAWQIPYALRVDSPANHRHSESDGQDTFVEPLLPPDGPVTPEDAARFRGLALASPELAGRLVARDGGAFGISVHLALPTPLGDARREVAQAVHAMTAGWEGQVDGLEVGATGAVLSGLTLMQAARDDLTTLVPLAFLLVMGLFAFLLRSAIALVSVLVTVAASALATLGFAGWAGIAMTAGTAISPLSVVVLAAASSVHMVLGWARAAEDGLPDPVGHALEENLGPITVSTLTTMVGFLCLNFAESPPLRDMGTIVAFGLLFALAAIFVVLPLGLRLDRRGGARAMPLGAPLMRRLADQVMAWRRRSLLAFALLVPLAASGLSQIGFDDSIFRYFSDRYEFRRDADAIQRRLTGLETLQFSMRAPGGSVFDPDFLRQVDAFQDWLAAQPEVAASWSVAGLLKQLNRAMHADDPAEHRIADSRAANAQLMLFYELSLPVGMDLTNIIDVDRTQTRVSASLAAGDSAQTRTLADRAEAWLAANAPAIATRAGGLSIAFARISERNNRQMLIGLGLALALVSATMVVTLRSLRMGALSLVPNLVPAVLAFGVWGVTIGDVNLGSTVVCAMTFGIVVDDTVHFMMHYLRRRRAGMAPAPAVRATVSVVGAAVVITSLAIMAGFALMTLSGFAINQHVGALTVFVVGFALVADLVLLPALLLTAEGPET